MRVGRAANSIEIDVGIDLRQRQIDAKRGNADAVSFAIDDMRAEIVCALAAKSWRRADVAVRPIIPKGRDRPAAELQMRHVTLADCRRGSHIVLQGDVEPTGLRRRDGHDQWVTPDGRAPLASWSLAFLGCALFPVIKL